MADDALTASAYRGPALLGGAAVALQIAYPIVHGTDRHHLIVAIVAVFAAASTAHALVTRGAPVTLAMLAVSAVGGFGVEVLGVHTGFPFGRYAYTSALGPRLFGAPPVVGLAWTMLAWPAALVARRLATSTAARIAVGAWALASWDLFLDPQMVSGGAWRWRHPDPHLPGVPDVPLTNYAGWLLVAAVMSALLQWLLRGDPGGGDAVPVALYLWTYAGSIVALGAFLGLGAAAGWGALGMGLVAVPLAWTLRR
jgi:uncharacterized membrane protein